MTAEQQRRQIEIIVQAALDIKAGVERERFIAEACGEDNQLQESVERLISTEEIMPQNNQESLIGAQIGVFKLQKELGRGGMGAVYLATRIDGEFEQQAAVKLIKRGMDTDFVVRRFRHERQILASLSHPHIARLIDGGTTADGLPYFVMEYVAGVSFYRYSDERKLNTKERLRLFRGVCEGVEAAHQIRVVHRDLKPSNILVKENGTPKLLDFGIAKILDPELASATLEPTATAMRLMTPEYASPEQVCGEEVTPASDIYSLGVLLYELLTGHRPYRLKNRALHEIHRAVCEEIPSLPSEIITSEDNLVPTAGGETDDKQTNENSVLTSVFAVRRTDFENLRDELAGDLDKIILKALRKNEAERYQTAGELAADITRYLEKRPVLAAAFAPEKRKVEIVSAPKKAENKQAIAVLPFKMFAASVEPDSDEFLSIGLADSLVTRLSVIRQIIVRPTSSVLPFGTAAGDPFAAGEKLAVDFVVDGSIRRVGERIRVTVQLLSVAENTMLWAQTFDEKFIDVLTLEDSISERIAKSLLPQLTGEEEKQLQQRGTNSPEAHEAYLRGRYFWNQFTPESFPKALESFQTAVALDPNYALAYVGIADFYIWANIYGLIPSNFAHAEAERAARRAIEMNPLLGEAYASLGLIVQNKQDWAEAEKIKLKAIELAPNYVLAHEWWAAQLVGSGRTSEGVAEILHAERLDPLSLRTKTLTAWTLFQARRFTDALERGRQIVDLDKNYPQGYSQIGLPLLGMKRYDEALPYFEKFEQMLPEFPLAQFQLCFALVATGQREKAQAVLESMKTRAANSYVKPYFMAMAHTALGERDAAFRYFEEALAETDPWLLWFGTDPLMASLHDDPRFLALLERMKNPIAEHFRK
jgi:eukaryotic-like serine/threonine-protein kinase